jgi:hypothetical protein
MGEMRNAHAVLVRKPEGKRSFGRPRHRWKDIIKMDLKINIVRGCGLNSAGYCEYSNKPFGFHKRQGIS